jgi:HSP20 family protein
VGVLKLSGGLRKRGSTVGFSVLDGGALSQALNRAWSEELMEQVEIEKQATEGTWRPKADIKLTPNEVTLFVDLPGVDEDTISFASDDSTVTIFGVREFNHDHEDSEDYIQLERTYGPYELKVSMPVGADAWHMTAKYNRGVLKIRIPRLKVAD